jgi:hypothetical protein
VLVAAEEIITTVDHSSIRGFGYPHERDPSGAASHRQRGFALKVHQISMPCALVKFSLRAAFFSMRNGRSAQPLASLAGDRWA